MAKLNDLQKAVVQKVIKTYDALQKEGNVSSLEEFCEKTGLDYSNFNLYRKLEKHIFPDQLVNLTNEFHVNKDWLLSKESEAKSQTVTIGDITGHNNAAGIDIYNKVQGSLVDQDCLNKLAVAMAEIEGYKREIARMEQTIASNQEMIKILVKSNT